MQERNPYAPPKAPLIEARNASCTRDGKFVVVQAGSDLPPRCILCNAPAAPPVKEVKLYWHTPWLYLLILINILLYIIVALIARRSVRVSPALCITHADTRKRRLLAILAVGSTALAAGIVLALANRADIAAAFFLLVLPLLVAGMVVARKVYAKKITKEYARIAGCKEPFLASLE